MSSLNLIDYFCLSLRFLRFSFNVLNGFFFTFSLFMSSPYSKKNQYVFTALMPFQRLITPRFYPPFTRYSRVVNYPHLARFD